MAGRQRFYGQLSKADIADLAAAVGGQVKGVWSHLNGYTAGDVVSYRGVQYLALVDMAAVGTTTSTVSDGLTTATSKPAWLRDGVLPTSVTTRAADGTSTAGEGAVIRDLALGSSVDVQGTFTAGGTGAGSFFVGTSFGNVSVSSGREGVFAGLTASSITLFGFARGESSTTLATQSWTLASGDKVTVRLQVSLSGAITASFTRSGTTTSLVSSIAGAKYFTRDLQHGMRTNSSAWKFTDLSSTVVTPNAFPSTNFQRLSSPVTRDDVANSTLLLIGA